MRQKLKTIFLLAVIICSTFTLLSIPLVEAPTVTPLSKAYIVFRFDDIGGGQWAYARPILAERDYFGSTYVVTSWVGGGSLLSWSQLQTLYDDYDWEIGSHSRTHVWLNNKSASVLESEIWGAKQDIEGNLTGVTVETFVAPFNAYNATVKKYVTANYSGMSGVAGVNSYPWDPYRLQNRPMTNTTTLAEVQSYIDDTIRYKRLLVLMFHNIEETPTGLSVSNATFQSIVDYVYAQGSQLEVVTASDAANLALTPNLVPNPNMDNVTGGWVDNWTRSDSNDAIYNDTDHGVSPTRNTSIQLTGDADVCELYSSNISIYANSEYYVYVYVEMEDLTQGNFSVTVQEFDSNGVDIGITTIIHTQTINFTGFITLNYEPTGSTVATARVRIYHETPDSFIAFFDRVIFLQSKAPTLESATITNMDAGNWLFAEEKYYDFELTANHENGSSAFDVSQVAFSDKYGAYGLLFDGSTSSYVQVANNTVFNSTVGTISLWLKPNLMDDTKRAFFHLHATLPNIFQNFVSIRLAANDTIEAWGYSNTTTEWRIYSNKTIDTTVWRQVTVTQDGTTVNLYIDGENVGSAISSWWTNDFAYSGWRIWLGKSWNFFSGKLDQVMIWNRGLSVSEVAYNYANYYPQNTTTMVLWLRMDEGTGSTTEDYSGYSNTGTIYGSQWVMGYLPETLNDAHWIVAYYDATSGVWGLTSGSTLARVKEGSTSTSGNQFTMTFSIYLTQYVLDTLNIELLAWSNDTNSRSNGWKLLQINYFNIYHLGGASELTSSGNAGRITGGDVFDLYAYNNSWVETTIHFRNLQHIKLLPEIFHEFNTSDLRVDNFLELKFQIDYCIDGVWLSGWSVTLKPINARGGGTQRFVTINVTWANRGVTVLTDQIRLYHTGVASALNTTWRIWLDFWFNRINSSSTVGGRINAYYYAMYDSSPAWLRWLTGSNWGIDETWPKQSMFFDEIEDANNNVAYTKQIEMVRVKCNLSVLASIGAVNIPSQISDFDIFDLTIGGDPFTGVQTPVFDETKVVVMPQGGFLGAVWTALMNLAKAISDAFGPVILGFWNIFVGFMDTIFTWAGWPNGFSAIGNWVLTFVGWIANSFAYLISLLTSAFLFLSEIIGKILNTLNIAITQWILIIQNIFSMLGGGLGTGINIWDALGLSTWVIIIAILYPVYLMSVWDEKGIDAVFNHVNMVINVLAWIGRISLTVIQVFFRIIQTIIESIPVVE